MAPEQPVLPLDREVPWFNNRNGRFYDEAGDAIEMVPMGPRPADVPVVAFERINHPEPGCCEFLMDAYSLKTTDVRVLVRRGSMWLIMVLRLAFDVQSISSSVVPINATFLKLGMAVVECVPFVWCLAFIGQAQGRRNVFGVTIERDHLDVFLLMAALVHTMLLAGSASEIGTVDHLTTWAVMCTLLFAAAFICVAPAEQNTQV